MTIPIRTNTTIATCVQIQNGDMTADSVSGPVRAGTHTGPDLNDYRVGMRGRSYLHMTAARSHRMLLSFGLALCLLAWLAPVGRGEHIAKAHVSTTTPLGGVNIEGVYSGASLAGVDRDIALARTLHAKVVRTEVPWSTLEPRGHQIDPRRWRSRSPDEGCGRSRHQGDRVRREHALLGLLGAGVAAAQMRARAARQGEHLATDQPGSLRDVRRLSGPALRHAPGGDRDLERAGPGQRRVLRRPEKPQHYAAILRAAYPAIKQANPNVP